MAREQVDIVNALVGAVVIGNESVMRGILLDANIGQLDAAVALINGWSAERIADLGIEDPREGNKAFDLLVRQQADWIDAMAEEFMAQEKRKTVRRTLIVAGLGLLFGVAVTLLAVHAFEWGTSGYGLNPLLAVPLAAFCGAALVVAAEEVE